MSDPNTEGLPVSPVSPVERLKGKAKQMAGAILGDPLLKAEGQLHEEKADAAKEASALGAEAEAEAAQAELTIKEQELAAERQRLAAEEAEEVREGRLARERQAEELRIEREHAQAEAAVERQEQARKAAVAADEIAAGRDLGENLGEAAALEAEADRHAAVAEALDPDPRS